MPPPIDDLGRGEPAQRARGPTSERGMRENEGARGYPLILLRTLSKEACCRRHAGGRRPQKHAPGYQRFGSVRLRKMRRPSTVR